MTSESKRGGGRAGARKGASGRPLRAAMSMDSEQSAKTLLFGGTILIILIALGFIAFGYYDSVIKPRNRTVLEVDGISVSYSAMKRRMAYDYTQSGQQLGERLGILPELSYQNLLNELTLISRAEEDLGLTVTAEEIETELRTRVGVTDAASEKEFADAFRRELAETGLHDGEYRRLVRAEVLETKATEKFQAEAPATLPQAKLDVIQTADRAIAEQAILRVIAGEEWALVAKELSSDPLVEQNSGSRDFQPRESISENYADYAFTAPPGEVSQPIEGADGNLYVVRVAAREDRELTEAQKFSYSQRALADWFTAMQEVMVIERDWDQEAQQTALLDVLEDAARRQADEAPVQNIPVQQPPVQQPPAEQPPAEQPPAEQPPAEQPPAAPPDGQ